MKVMKAYNVINEWYERNRAMQTDKRMLRWLTKHEAMFKFGKLSSKTS